jgi:hypothetical protein
MFCWVFIDGFLLSLFGTTPGKWLFRIKITDSLGRMLTLPVAFRRSIAVWLLGFGAGIPIVNLITQLVAYNKLKKDGITSWDREWDCVVFHGKITQERLIVIVTIIWALIILILYLLYTLHEDSI